MKPKVYDTLIIGPLSLDIMIDYKGNIDKLVGGAVVQSGYAAANTGSKTAIFTKLNIKDVDVYGAFRKCNADIYWKPSCSTTSIKNQYFTADQEQRECHLLSSCEEFSIDELPPLESKIYHFAGLTVGDFDNEMIVQVAKRGQVAVDVQCLLRKAEKNGEMKFYDWEGKKDYLPFVDFLKTDAAEAKILTGLEDRQEAAKKLFEWGAKEVMITHNTEVLVYDGKQMYTCPIKARSLVGRTGRGDTTFAGYVTQRLHKGVEESLLFATALVSLKMEKLGPFVGSYEDVKAYINEFYQEASDVRVLEKL